MTKNWHYTLVMILCFIYGGISLLFFLMQIMSVVSPQPFGGPPFTERLNETLFRGAAEIPNNTTHESIVQFQGRVTSYFYLVIFVSLFGSVISIIAGLMIHFLLKKKEKKELTKSVIEVMTTPDEKKVIKELEENGGQLTQSELSERTKMSKVKVHRVVKRLESMGIVSKYSYGMTNKIKLEKKVFEGGK